jgi:hypothetical protein
MTARNARAAGKGPYTDDRLMSQPSAFPDAPTEDRRILDELEQLQQAIRTSRETRERAEAAFDGELRAFETRVPPSSAVPAAPALTAPAESAAPAPAPVGFTLPKPNPSPAVALFDDGPVPSPALPRPRTALIVAGIAVAVGVLAGYLWTMQRGADGGAGQPAVVQPQAVATATEAPGAATKPVSGDPHALRVDLTSLRRVWLRVSVDGRIALEREVPAGERMPFGADRSIVVRAGDAGAVTVRVGPDDQGPLGRDGQVVTRAFNVGGR